VECRLRGSLKRYAAFYSCGRWTPAIPTWVTTQSHDVLFMFVDFGLYVTNTQSHDLLSMFADFRLSVPTSGIPRLLTTPGLNLMSYHAAQTSSARIQDVDVILIWRLCLPGVEPGISRSYLKYSPTRPNRHQITSTKTVKCRVRLPGNIIFRLRLHQEVSIWGSAQHTRMI